MKTKCFKKSELWVHDCAGVIPGQIKKKVCSCSKFPIVGQKAVSDDRVEVDVLVKGATYKLTIDAETYFKLEEREFSLPHNIAGLSNGDNGENTWGSYEPGATKT